MELKNGMYVRYTRGMINEYVPPKIAKIVDCSDNELIKIDNGQVILRSDVIKARHKIIDLIEVGDYVNGYYAEDVFDTYIYVATGTNYFQSPTIYEQDIKSIVTKEQFDSVRYEVE